MISKPANSGAKFTLQSLKYLKVETWKNSGSKAPTQRPIRSNIKLMERKEPKTTYKEYQIKHQIYTPPLPASGTPTMQNLTNGVLPDYKQLKVNYRSLFYWDEQEEGECYRTILQHQRYCLCEWSLLKMPWLAIYFGIEVYFRTLKSGRIILPK